MEETDKIIEKIQKLLGKAASTNFSAERDTALALADKLMTAHAIESFMVEMHKPANERKNKPEVRNFKISLGDKPEGVNPDTWSDLRNIMYGLFGEAVRFCRCRQVNLSWNAQVIGYTDDLAYLQELYLSLQMQMLSALSPRVDPTQDYITNLVSLKESGLKWTEIYARLKAGGFFPDRDWSHALGVKFTNDYKKFCEASGRRRMNTGNPKIYFRSFTQGYRDGVATKMNMIKRDRERDSGAALVPVNDELTKFYYELFPDRKPHAPDCDCDGCHICQAPKCQRRNCKERRKPVRYRTYREPSMDPNAIRNGRAAGSTVDLGGARVTGSSTKGISG